MRLSFIWKIYVFSHVIDFYQYAEALPPFSDNRFSIHIRKKILYMFNVTLRLQLYIIYLIKMQEK